MWELAFDVVFITVYISLLTVEWSKILASYMSQGCFQAGCGLDPRHRDQSPWSQHLILSPCRSLVLGDKAPLHVTKPQYCIGLHPYTTEFPDSSPNRETCGECSPGSALHSLQQAVRHGGCTGIAHPLYPRCPPLGRSTWLQPPGAFSTLRWPRLLLQSVSAGKKTGEGEEKPPSSF